MTAPAIPLLQTIAAAGAPAVEPAVLLAAVAVVGALCWLRAPRRRAARRAVRAAITAMALLAVLPSVLPYDHLLPGAHNDAPAAEATHAQHCHGSPGSCADAPIAAGPGQFIFVQPLVIAPAMLALLVAVALPALTGISLRPPTRPPQPGLAAA